MSAMLDTPTPEAIQVQIARFQMLDRNEYLQEIGPRRSGRSYFIIVDDRFLDMKAIWFGACEPKPKHTPHSPAIAKTLGAMGFQIYHGSHEESTVLSAIERHRRIEGLLWTRSRQLSEECKRRANFQCEACSLHHPDRYSDIDGSLLEAHHVRPFEVLTEAKKFRVQIEDLVALCANCHRMIHAFARQQGQNPSLEEFRSRVQR